MMTVNYISSQTVDYITQSSENPVKMNVLFRMHIRSSTAQCLAHHSHVTNLMVNDQDTDLYLWYIFDSRIHFDVSHGSKDFR